MKEEEVATLAQTEIELDARHVALPAVLRVAHALVPAWRAVAPADAALRELRGGITNKIVLLHAAALEPHACARLVCRIYGRGSAALIDRAAEIAALRRLAACGRGPTLHGAFANGLLLDFVPGRSLDAAARLRERPTVALVARQLAQWHAPPVSRPSDVATPLAATVLFSRLERWCARVPAALASAVDRPPMPPRT